MFQPSDEVAADSFLMLENPPLLPSCTSAMHNFFLVELMQNPYVTLRHYGFCLRLTPLWVQSTGSHFLATGCFERVLNVLVLGCPTPQIQWINGETNMFGVWDQAATETFFDATGWNSIGKKRDDLCQATHESCPKPQTLLGKNAKVHYNT